jgi:hypothetical protein
MIQSNPTNIVAILVLFIEYLPREGRLLGYTKSPTNIVISERMVKPPEEILTNSLISASGSYRKYFRRRMGTSIQNIGEALS